MVTETQGTPPWDGSRLLKFIMQICEAVLTMKWNFSTQELHNRTQRIVSIFWKLSNVSDYSYQIKSDYSLSSFPTAAVTNYHKFGGLNREMYSLAVLEARSSKSRYHAGPCSPWRLYRSILTPQLSSLRWLLIILCPLFEAASLQSPPPSSHDHLLCVNS